MSDIKLGIIITDTLTHKTNFLKSRGEARRALNENSISVLIKKVKVKEENFINLESLINGKYILFKEEKKELFRYFSQLKEIKLHPLISELSNLPKTSNSTIINFFTNILSLNKRTTVNIS